MKRLFQCPTSSQSSADLVRANACLARPISKYLSLAVKGNAHVASFVSRLLPRWKPSAIARFVIAVIVFTLYFVPVWAWPHVGKEGFKRVFPPRTHEYAAPAVILEGGHIGVARPVLDIQPHRVLAAFLSLSGVAVFQPAFLIELNTPATAGYGVAAKQIIMEGNCYVAALAATLPFVGFALPTIIFQHSQFAEYPSSQILKSWISGKCHAGSMDITTVISRTK